MPEPVGWAWALRLAEGAVRGVGGARAELRTLLPSFLERPGLLRTPRDADQLALFLALVREAGEDAVHEATLHTATRRARAGDVPEAVAGAVCTRIGVLCAESGEYVLARGLLRRGLEKAGGEAEVAQACTHLAAVLAGLGDWPAAVEHARLGLGLAGPERGERLWLDVRMRCRAVLFRAALRDGGSHRAASMVGDLERACDALIAHWGPEHPRALAALATLAAARHEIAALDGDLPGAERLLDVLAVAAQRTAVTLGARHPQTRAVREALARAGTAVAALRTAESAPPSVRGDDVLVGADRHAGPPETSAARSQPPPAKRRRRRHRPSPDHVPLELIVHGIVGTDPRELLDDPRITRTQGDRTAGFYRRTEEVDAEGRTAPVTEAYGWSERVTGAKARLGWLFLLPFTLVNLAHWARPAAPAGSRTVRLHGLLVRLLALTLTVTLVAGACALALDVLAWQCVGTHACAARHGWLDLVAPDSDGGGGWWTRPGARLVWAAFLPTALVALLWWLSRRTAYAYEAQRPWERSVEPEDLRGAPLAGRGFWYGLRLVTRLRAAHTAAGLLTVAAWLTAAPAAYDRAREETVGRVWGWALWVLILAGGLLVTYVVIRRGRSENEPDQRDDRFTTRTLYGLALAALLGAVGYALWPRPGWVSSGRLFEAPVFGTFALVQAALAAGLAVLGVVLHRRRLRARSALRGLAPPAFAVLACGLVAALVAAVVSGAADLLTARRADLPGVPPELAWQAAVVPGLVVVMVVLGRCVVARAYPRRDDALEAAEREYRRAAPDAARTRHIATAIRQAGRLDSAPRLVAVTALAALLLNCTGGLGASLGSAPPHVALTLGPWAVAAAVLYLLIRFATAYRDPGRPGALGVLWDIGTFWSRAAHPFAPPCYAERAVPDLTWRIGAWAESTHGRLLLSAHGTGSALAAAAIWQLDPEVRRRIVLFTYGSPLGRIYGCWFPSCFGPGALTMLDSEVRDWRNLWRLTDPVGGPIGFVGAYRDVDQANLADPATYGRTPEHPLLPPVLGHGDYRKDPVFAEERRELLVHATPPPPTPPVRLPDAERGT